MKLVDRLIKFEERPSLDKISHLRQPTSRAIITPTAYRNSKNFACDDSDGLARPSFATYVVEEEAAPCCLRVEFLGRPGPPLLRLSFICDAILLELLTPAGPSGASLG